MMNYEANPCQDYESITIDELKERTSSLLNLVTEGQRPLRVCMNNGKEFLLFPHDLLAPIYDSDFRLILLSAMQYAMGRIQDEISTVREYVGLYEHAPQMKAADVSDYRHLAAFGDTVLAATYSEKNGFIRQGRGRQAACTTC